MIPLFIVDAFSDRPFRGNPAGVCLLQQDESDQWKQQLASEVNLAETAFVVRSESGFALRWFTPVCEVELCGHATLASSHVLWQEGWVPRDDPIVFQTRSGKLTCTRKADDMIDMDFPIESASASGIPDGLSEAFGLSRPPVEVLRNRFDYLVVLDSPDVLRNLQPDYMRLSELPSRGWIVTAQSDQPEFDILSRFFAPNVGINEDPVTGSAHCCLASYWSEKLDKTEFRAYQCSPRGGVVRASVQGDRVQISGHATTVIWGQCSGPRSGAN